MQIVRTDTVGVVAALVVLGSVVGLFVHQRNQERDPVTNGRPLREWIQDISNQDYRVRERAMESIHALGATAVPSLVSELSRRDWPLRKWTARFASSNPKLGLDPRRASRGREAAAKALGEMPIHAASSQPALVLALADPEQEVAREAARALRRMGESAVPALVQGLQHSSTEVRARAAQTIAELGLTDAAVITRLTIAARDPAEQVRREAVLAIGSVEGSLGLRQAASFRSMLDPSPEVRAEAAGVFIRLQPLREAHVKRLKDLLNDSSALVRVSASKTLWEIEMEAAPLLPVLIEAVVDKSVGWQAALVLGKLGAHAAPAVPALISALKQEPTHRPLRTPPSSALALGRIGKTAVRPLIEALPGQPVWVQTSIVIALGFIGQDAAPASSLLIERLDHRDDELRQATALSLGAIKPDAPGLARVLIQIIKGDDISMSTTALALLERIDPEAASEFAPK